MLVNFPHSSPPRAPAKYFYNISTILPRRARLQNVSTILPQFFLVWCIRIGLGKNCRRKNRRRIVEIFGEFRPSEHSSAM
jgi:hypothetical protein